MTSIGMTRIGMSDRAMRRCPGEDEFMVLGGVEALRGMRPVQQCYEALRERLGGQRMPLLTDLGMPAEKLHFVLPWTFASQSAANPVTLSSNECVPPDWNENDLSQRHHDWRQALAVKQEAAK